MPKRYRVVAAPAGDPRGRHLVATADLPAGCCVLREPPYAFVLNSDAAGARCGCCLAPRAPGETLARCSRCKSEFYLSPSHQRRAWAAGHREECKCMAAAAEPGRLPPPAARLALRVALTAHAHGDLKMSHLLSESPGGGSAAGVGVEEGELTDPEGFVGVLGLLSHWSVASDAVKLRHAQLGAWAWRALESGCSEASKDVSLRDLAHMVARLAANNHAICDAELRPLGLGIYPLMAMANHSCQPSCAHTFGSKGSIELRTIRPVAAREELTIAYVELAAPRWERRRALLAGHFFDIDADGGAGNASGPEHGASSIVSVSDTEFGRHVHHRGAPPPWLYDPRDLELSSFAGPGQGSGGGIWGRILDSDESIEVSEQLLGDLAQAFAGEFLRQEEIECGGGGDSQRVGVDPGRVPRLEVHTWANDADSKHMNALKYLAARYAEGLHALHGAATGAVPPQELAARLEASLDRLTTPSSDKLSIGPRHVLRLRLLAALLKALVEAGGQWAEALQAARDLLPLYEFAYPGDMWPPLALHLATLAKLEHLAGEPAIAAAVARRALAALEATAGPGGEARAEMERIWREAATEARGRTAD